MVAVETILLAGLVLVLIAAAVVAYGTAQRVLHDYYRPLTEYRPFGDALRP